MTDRLLRPFEERNAREGEEASEEEIDDHRGRGGGNREGGAHLSGAGHWPRLGPSVLGRALPVHRLFGGVALPARCAVPEGAVTRLLYSTAQSASAGPIRSVC
ncbi:hypothetical protein MRX96_055804 [Rhipicephalus microplus]